MRPDGPREPLAGPDSGPEPPFPIKLSGPIIKGFGRGSKELGIPTANIPPSGLDAYPSLDTGVYYGLVGLLLPDNPSTSETSGSSQPQAAPPPNPSIHDAVLSIGYNPFYANKTRSIEIHILSPSPTSTTTPAVAPTSSSTTTTTTTTTPPPTSKPPPAPPTTTTHQLPASFYGAPLNLLILGYIRPEYDYVSRESLVDDIMTDCDVARQSLLRPAYRAYEAEGGEAREWLLDFGWVRSMAE